MPYKREDKDKKIPKKKLLDIHNAVAKVVHELRTEWSQAKEMKVGLLDVLGMHQWHFTLRDAYQDERDRLEETPEEQTIYYQMDFLEHKTLPLGPDEGGQWWYANARLGVTLLVIYVWGIGLTPTHHAYCSHTMDQTPEFVVACLQDLHKKIGGASKWRRHVMFSDVGHHFRATYTLGFWGTHLHKQDGVEETRWVFAPDGHGKGVCDGQGGRITQWLQTLAKKHVISDLKTFCKLLKGIAQEGEKRNPDGTKSLFHVFVPPKKSKLPKVYVDDEALRDDGVPIRSIFAWSFRKRLSGVRWYAHSTASVLPERWCNPRILSKSPAGGNDWKEYYRRDEPEKSDMKLGSLSKAWDRMRNSGIALSLRRRTWVERCRKFAKTIAKQKAMNKSKKAAMVKTKAAKADPELSSTSSYSSSSES